jgi:transcription termination factor Rho
VSVLQREELEGSPLADLHAIASELGIEGYRSLRTNDLVKAILDAQGIEDDGPADDAEESPVYDESDADADGPDAELDDEPQADADDEPEADDESDAEPEAEAERVTGVLDVLPNGSGFLRVSGAGQSRDDVYVSPAQIRRCELRAGDEVEGPLRPARRNERHPSLVRVEKVNGGDAEPPEQRPNFSDLTAVHATERLPAPKVLADFPFGKGSRVAIAGAPGSGLTRLLGEIVETLSGAGESVSLVLVAARPEEVTGWHGRDGVAVSGGSFDRSIEAQTQAAELAVERGKRAAERGADAIVAIDSLEALPHGAARRLFGAARKLDEGGSLTVIAVVGGAPEPLRQASTRITLDAAADEPTVLAPRSTTQRSDLLS